MRGHKQFPGALGVVIANHANGSQSEFAEKVGVVAPTISRLCAGTREITRETLARIAKDLPVLEKRRLYLAAVRDYLPEEGKELLFPNQSDEPILLSSDEVECPELDQETQEFLAWLHRDAALNPDTCAWLKKLASWIHPRKSSTRPL